MAEISEIERDKIKKEAKQILDRFGKSLEKVKLKKKEEKKVLGGFRMEGEGVKSDEEFRKRMFENASSKNEDFIIAEKKKW